MKKLVIGILAHVDAGKTTLSEGLLYLCGGIRKIGRVDHGDAFLDTYELEKESHCIALYGESGKTIICIKRDDAFSTGKDYGNEMLGEGKTGYQ